MLSDERIRELAIMAVSPYYCWSPSVDQAIRLAVAETAEACKAESSDTELLNALCDMVSQSFTSGEWYITESLRGETFKDAIRTAAKEGKK